MTTLASAEPVWYGAHTSAPPAEPGAAPTLYAGRCPHGHRVFPFQTLCPHDLEPLERFALSGRGTLYSWSVVHVAPREFATPYTIGYVDTPERVRVFAQLPVEPARLRIGMPLVATIGTIRHDADGPVHGYQFVPSEEA